MASSALHSYRTSQRELIRTDHLLSLMPRDMHSVLDIGARDGHFSALLTQYFEQVTALDLEMPKFAIPGVTNVAGNATRLQFADASFDVVFCAEVLEHIPDLQSACNELARVAKHQVLVGVPYRQDTRCGRTTCASCGKISPPWGHVNAFDEAKLRSLFPGRKAEFSFPSVNTSAATNSVSRLLMDLAGNPWGTYGQDEPCIHCGAQVVAPMNRALWQRGCSAVANLLNKAQQPFNKSHANWIHARFTR
jgi:SAM-dependent methyltransferase